MNSLLHGFELTAPGPGIGDDRLDTALDLYSASYAESSQSAKLLTLVTCLESISKSERKHEVAQQLMDNWEVGLKSVKRYYASDSEEYDSLDALERELSFRRGSSLRSQIWKLVYDSLSPIHGEELASSKARRMREIYDQRSTVVHEGNLPKKELSSAVRDAADIIGDVLKATIRAQ